MRYRPLAAIPIALTFSAAACQLIWGYDGLKDGAGGSGGARAASTTSSSGRGGESSSSSSFPDASVDGSSDAGGDAGCPPTAPDAGACDNACDRAAMQANQCRIQKDIFLYGACYGQGTPCLVATDELSAQCAACWVGLESCGGSGCDYLNGPCMTANSAGCNACLDNACESSFKACSGVDRPGSLDGGSDASCN